MRPQTPTADRLARLAADGSKAATRASDAVDWTAPIKPPAWMPRRGYITAVSQFYHGELATIEICKRVLPELADPLAQEFVRTQIADEERHAALYARYLNQLGGIGEIEAGVAKAYQGARAWRGTHLGPIILSHIVLEGEGLRLQHLYSRWFPCPLFRQINRTVARDEARHVAFGKIYLRRTLPDLPLDERMAIYRWIRSMWFDCADAIRGEMPQSIVLLLGRTWMADRWRQPQRDLVAIGLVGDDEIARFERC